MWTGQEDRWNENNQENSFWKTAPSVCKPENRYCLFYFRSGVKLLFFFLTPARWIRLPQYSSSENLFRLFKSLKLHGFYLFLVTFGLRWLSSRYMLACSLCMCCVCMVCMCICMCMSVCACVIVCVCVCVCVCERERESKNKNMALCIESYWQLSPECCVQVVVNLDDIMGVRVDEEDVRYFGKSHIVVILLNTGMTVGITESYTFGSSK